MSIPKEFTEKVKEKLDKMEFGKKVLSDEELKEKIPKFLEFEEKHSEDDQVFNDGYADWLFVQSPKIPKDEKGNLKKDKDGNLINGPIETPSDFNPDNWRWSLKTKLGIVGFFGEKTKMNAIGSDKVRVIRGKLNNKFHLVGNDKKYKTLEALAKATECGVDDLVKDDDYNVLRSFNVYQVIK